MITPIQQNYNVSFQARKMPKNNLIVHCFNGKEVVIDENFIKLTKKVKPSIKDILLEIFPMFDSRYRAIMKNRYRK